LRPVSPQAETDASFAACIFTHFHYVNGTRALLEAAEGELPIFGHVGIEANLRRFGGEAAPRYTRGLIHQFGATRFSTSGTRRQQGSYARRVDDFRATA
jgi:hypothetical protein